MQFTVNEKKTIDRAFKIMNKYAISTRVSFNSTQAAKDYFHLKLSTQENESFEVAFLDSQYGLISCDTVALGTVDAAHVYVRNVAQKALEHNAVAVVLAHNHPSGSLEPSEPDKRVTQRIQTALALFDIKVLDHIIIGKGVVSFAELGLLKEM